MTEEAASRLGRLAEAAIGGDRRARDTLLAELESPVLRAAMAVTGRRSLAEEAAVDALTKVWRGLAGLRDPGAVLGWARKLSVRSALDVVKRRNERDAAQAVSESVFGTLDVFPGGGNPEDEASLAQRAEAVRRAVDALPEPERSILYALYFAGLTLDEASEALGIPRRTLARRAGRGRLLLAAALEDLSEEVSRD